jgi:RNA polymerase sigma factor (sigma-70 family)
MKIPYSDQQIIDGLKGDDQSLHRAFQNAFYYRYSNFIFKVALSKCRNFADPEGLAKDVTQETFIGAFRAIKKFSLPADTTVEEQTYVVKAWLGRIGNNCFNKIYKKRMDEITLETVPSDVDETICPICNDPLIQLKDKVVCEKGHYKLPIGRKLAAPLPEDFNSFDLFESLYGDGEAKITNEFRQRLQTAMNALDEKQKHIVLTYANEGCLSSRAHLRDPTLAELCRMYNTTSDNIKHIKNRALAKIKSICFPENE